MNGFRLNDRNIRFLFVSTIRHTYGLHVRILLLNGFHARVLLPYAIYDILICTGIARAFPVIALYFTELLDSLHFTTMQFVSLFHSYCL